MKRNIEYLGDCLELIPKHIENKSVDLVLADLPFGTTNCKWDYLIPLHDTIDGLTYDEFMLHCFKKGFSFKDAANIFKRDSVKGLWSNYNRIIKDDGIILLFAQTPFDKVLGESNTKMLRYEWIWEKTQATGHLNAKKMPMKAHENILVFYKNKPTNMKKEDFNRTYNYIKTTGHVRKVVSKENRDTTIERTNKLESYLYSKQDTSNNVSYDSTERYPRSVIEFASDKQKSSLHPTQKPLALIKYFIETYSNLGDLVLDNTAGSGTTGLGCKELGRYWIMMEKDPKISIDCQNRVK